MLPCQRKNMKCLTFPVRGLQQAVRFNPVWTQILIDWLAPTIPFVMW